MPTTGSHTFNVQDYGAIGNGIADDTAAFLAALGAARTSVGYGIASAKYIPAGTYVVTQALVL